MQAEPLPTRPTNERVAITAVGLASPLGLGLPANLDALQHGRDAIRPVSAFDTSHTRCKTAGSIPAQALDSHLRDLAIPDRLTRHLHPAAKMLAAAARQTSLADPRFQPDRLILGTTSGGMSFGESWFRSYARPGQPAGARHLRRATLLANYPPQKAASDAQRASGYRAPSTLVATACASGTDAIGLAFHTIRAGLANAILCGGYDALSELVFDGFDSLQAATPDTVRPFDRDRSGLALGEGAALLALERMDSALARNAPILAEIRGYGAATDTHHLTQPHPSGQGPKRAMERALQDARLQPSDIGYINAHGTATTFNDATEGAAIASLLPHTPTSSTKSMMGHALGAAGAIEAAFCVLALQHHFLPPNIHFQNLDPALDLDIVANHPRTASPRHVLSNSFGFGGTNASIILSAAT